MLACKVLKLHHFKNKQDVLLRCQQNICLVLERMEKNCALALEDEPFLFFFFGSTQQGNSIGQLGRWMSAADTTSTRGPNSQTEASRAMELTPVSVSDSSLPEGESSPRSASESKQDHRDDGGRHKHTKAKAANWAKPECSSRCKQRGRQKMQACTAQHVHMQWAEFWQKTPARQQLQTYFQQVPRK